MTKILREIGLELTKGLVVLALFIACLTASSFSAYALDQDQFWVDNTPPFFCGNPIDASHNGPSCGLCTLGADAVALPVGQNDGLFTINLSASDLPQNFGLAPVLRAQHTYFGRAPPFAV